jgi:MFS family permease
MVAGSPGGSTFFSGRLMLAIAALALFLSGPGQTYGVSAFVDPMLADLGWSRSLFSTAYSIGTLVSAGVMVIAGRQIDRAGNRVVLTIAALGFGAALLLLSFAGGLVAVLIGFSLLRAHGMGMLSLGARTLVPHWFHTRTGRAFSILGLAGMLSQAAVPPFNELLIDHVGWRAAWRVNAAIIWLVLLPAVALLVRNRPEEVGRLPEGAPPSDAEPVVEHGPTLREARRTPAFWALLGAGVVPSLVVTGLSFNQVTILTEQGLPRSLAATTFAVDAAVALPVALATGWFVDRFPVRHALAAGPLFLALAMAVLLVADAPWLAFLYAALRGISNGIWMVAADVAWPAYFGRRHLGSIRGAGFAVGVAGAALGPIPFGLAYDLLDGYDPAIAGLLALPVMAMIAVWLARPPAPTGERR